MKKILLGILLFAGAVGAEHRFEIAHASDPNFTTTPSLSYVKAFNLGLSTATASFLWLGARSEAPHFPYGPQKYLDDVGLVNDIDPRLAPPYVFSTLVLPSLPKFPNGADAAITIGERGVASSDHDWRIPFYLAAAYHLHRKDDTNAAKYFDVAAGWPGIPETVRSFAMNFGLLPDARAKTIALWKAVYDSAPDESTRTRAKAYLEHFAIADILQSATNAYHATHRAWPESLETLIRAGYLKDIPQDPFGFTFTLFPGGQIGISR